MEFYLKQLYKDALIGIGIGLALCAIAFFAYACLS